MASALLSSGRRLLARSRCFADIDSLLHSRRRSFPHTHRYSTIVVTEPFLSAVFNNCRSASMLPNARQLFDEIPDPTPTSVNALLLAHLKAKRPNEVPPLFDRLFSKRPWVLDSVSFEILIKSFCLCGEVDKALQAFAGMKARIIIQPTITTYKTLIACLYKKHKPEEAGELWKEMVIKGLKPGLSAHKAKAMYLAAHGRPEEVVEVMKEMEANGLSPDATSHNYLISCYCRKGRFEEAKEAYREFLKKRIEPNEAVFRMLAQALCRNGDFDGALEVARDSMKHDNIPGYRMMVVLVEGLLNGGKAGEAKEVTRIVQRSLENLLGRWKNLEEQVGLFMEGKVVEQVESS